MKTAETLTVELERLMFGQPWAELHDASKSLVAVERAAADKTVFPRALGPTGADLVAVYRWLTERLGPAGYGDMLAKLHDRELAEHPELARLFRSEEALSDVTEAACRFVHPMTNTETIATAQQRAAVIAVEKYKRAITAQLAAVDGALGDAARALVACDALDARIDVAKTRLEQQAAAAVVAIEEEKHEADRAIAAANAQRVREAEAAAAAAATEAKRAQDALRTTRIEAIADELRRRLAEMVKRHPDGTSRSNALVLSIGDWAARVDVAGLLRDLPFKEPKELAFIERAVFAGRFEVA